jgi:hypothetical protein
MASYIPQRDSDLGQWMGNFSTLITASPGVYGLTAGDATTIATYVNAFSAALAVVNNPATKTKATVATKDGAKAAMLDIVRPYAIQVRNNNGVSNADKTALGLTIVDRTPTPVPPPASSPLINVIAATPGEHTLRFSDSNAPDKRGKPAGTIGLQLFVAVASGAVGDPAVAPFKAFVTRQPYAVAFEPADNGKLATYFARWQNGKGDVGPWSTAITFTIVS